MTACNQSPTEEVYNQPYQIGRAESGFLDQDDRFTKENLDLQAVGALLERANNAEDFEYLLNSEESGINNLDLNDDGYADYISVREFDDRDGNERGFSLFSMFGPELIQEIATIVFDRNRNGYDNGYYPGARVLLRGDEDLYGDNYYYETDWQDRNVPFVNWAYNDRNDYYTSPYYYENYPSYYEPYQVVETPVYRTRINQYYSTPVFVQTAQPTVTQINIVSPYKDKSLKKVYADLPKPTREQLEFRKNNPKKSVEFDRNNKENQNFAVREDKQFKDNPNKFENQERMKNEKPQQMRDKPNKQERVNVQPQQQQMKVERQNQPKLEKQNQQRVERQANQQIRVERQNPVKMERQNMKPQKQENRVQPNGNGGGGKQNGGGGKQNGGGNNPGGGGKQNGGGKGKGKP